MQEQSTLLEPLSALQMAALEEAVASYEAALTADAVAYLLGPRRGLDKGTVLTARLGVVDDPFPGHTRYAGMIAIPYLDRLGRPVQIRFHCPVEHQHTDFFHGKYNGLAGEPTRMYGVDALFTADNEIHVTEGEFDALVLRMLGLPSVAIPGANNWKARHRENLLGFSRIFVWGDADDAGADFTLKITRQLRQAVGVRLPTKNDITSLYNRDGSEAILRALDEARAL